MRAVVITIRRRGAPARRWVGIFASTADAIVHALDTLGEAALGGSISARELAR